VVLAGSAVLAACALLPAAGLASGPEAHAAAKKKKPPTFFSKARVRSDGYVNPGQLETIFISHLPSRSNFKLAIEPPPTTPQCGQLYFCNFVNVFPAPGTRAFHSNGHGKAFPTFVMPSTYTIQSDPFDKRTRQTVSFANGQSVHINVLSIKNTRKGKFIAYGFGRTIVSVPG
jgi:hypothetical protein